MRKKRLARLTSQNGENNKAETEAEAEKPMETAEAMQVEEVTPPKSKDEDEGASKSVSVDFDSGIENMDVDQQQQQQQQQQQSQQETASTSSSSEAEAETMQQKRLRTSSSPLKSSAEIVAAFIANVFKVEQEEQEAGEESAFDAAEAASGVLFGIMEAITDGDFPSGVPKKTFCLKDSRLAYLMSSFMRLEKEERELEKKKSRQMVNVGELVLAVRAQIMRTTVLVLNGAFETEDNTANSLPYSPLLKPIVEETIPAGFLVELVAETLRSYEWSVFQAIFSPLLNCLIAEVRKGSLAKDGSYTRPVRVLAELAEIRVGVSTNQDRPFCRLMVVMNDWLPETVSDCPGREITATSLLGPLFALSVFAEEDPQVAEKFFADSKTSNKASFAKQLQSELEILRKDLHRLIHTVLVNGASRDAALGFLAQVLERNGKRAQMHVDERVVAGDGFMINFVSVMQQLANKVKLEKVDPLFMHMEDNGTVVIPKDETRLKMSSQEFEDWVKEAAFSKEPASFNTKCWYLTLVAHHLSVLPCIRRYERRVRALRDMQKAIAELERTEPQWKSHPQLNARNRQMLTRYKRQFKRLTRSKAASDAGLLDPNLFMRCMTFFSSVCEFMLRAMQTGEQKLPAMSIKLPLDPDNVPAEFASLPEWIIDDLADFLLFALQSYPHVVVDNIDDNVLTFLLVVACTPNYFNNPYLGKT